MIDFGPVIAVHGSRGVIESRQQIGLDIPNLGRVIIQAVEHILHMREVHFQEAAFYHLTGVVIPGNADIWPLRKNRLQHQFNQFIYTLSEFVQSIFLLVRVIAHLEVQITSILGEQHVYILL